MGPPQLLDHSGRPVAGLGPGKPLALLAYLALSGAASRETVVTLLWGDVSEARARNAFRQTLHRLRTALGEDTLPQQPGSVELVPARVTTDVAAFESALRGGRTAEALALYRGEFLQGLNVDSPGFSQWAEEQRERLAARYRAAVTRAAEQALEAGDAPRAAELAQTLTTIAPLDAEAAVLEATALVAAGRRAEAIAALTLHGRRVQGELGRSSDALVAKMLGRLVRSGETERDADARAGPAAAADRIPFIGRERELTTLLAMWRRVQRGAGEMAVVAGPEGIGKTRLLEEFVERTRSLGPVTIFRGSESSHTDGVAYGSIAEALRNVGEAAGVAGASQHLLAEAARLLPQLRDKFQLPEPGPITDDAERIRFYEGLAALLDALAYERPLLLIVEDVHRAPETTLSLIRYLRGRLGGVAALIVLTARSSGRDALPGELLTLEPLSEEDSLELLDRALAGEHPTPEERRRLVGLSGGVPYRLLDLAERAVAAEVPTAAPVRLRDVMQRRLQRCTPHQQRVFVAAALLGRSVPIRLLAAAAHLSEPAALDAVLELERKGLVEQRRDGVEPANATAAELALESTGAAGVALLAGWAADALSRSHDSRAAELVRLYALAGQRENLYPHAMKAAWEAAVLGATNDATAYATLAADTALSAADRETAGQLVRTLGAGALRLAGGGMPAAQPPAGEASDSAARGTNGPRSQAPAGPGRPAAADRTATRWPVRPQIAVAGVAVLLLAAALRFALAERAPAPGAMLSDTLVVGERGPEGELRYYEVYGSLLPAPTLVRQRLQRAGPGWMEALTPPWTNPLISPDGNRVAVEHVTVAGSDLFIITADGRDTIPVAVGRGDAIGAGWSPDGSLLLALHGTTDRAGEYHTGLVAHAADDPVRVIAFDTGSAAAVVEAAWSPRGDHVAWTARIGRDRQQEIFVGAADGSQRRNVSNHPAEDFQLAWAPDGERLAFISERDGGAEIYAYELATGELRRMTFDLAPKSQLGFSPDGRFLAYESTRGGMASVYLMPSWAGAPRRIAEGERRLRLVEWRGARPRFAQRVRVRAPVSIAPGSPTPIAVETSDQAGDELESVGVRWHTLDPDVLTIRETDASRPGGAEILGRIPGLARIVADLGGWRADTVFVQVAPAATVVQSSFAGGSSRGWRVVGPAPVPPAAGDGVVLGGRGRLETGLLSEAAVPLSAGTTLRVRLRAPFASAALPAGWTVALVAAEAARPDPRQERLRSWAGIEWRGESVRLAYAADREVVTESSARLGAGVHEFTIRVEEDGAVSFLVDGELRRRSTVRLLAPGEEHLAQVWIAGRGDRGAVVVESIEAGRGSLPRPAQQPAIGME